MPPHVSCQVSPHHPRGLQQSNAPTPSAPSQGWLFWTWRLYTRQLWNIKGGPFLMNEVGKNGQKNRERKSRSCREWGERREEKSKKKKKFVFFIFMFFMLLFLFLVQERKMMYLSIIFLYLIVHEMSFFFLWFFINEFFINEFFIFHQNHKISFLVVLILIVILICML